MLDRIFILAYIIRAEIHSVNVIKGVLIESVAVHEDIFLSARRGEYRERIDNRVKKRKEILIRCQGLR